MSTLDHKEVGRLFDHIYNTLRRNSQICVQFAGNSATSVPARFAQRNAEIMAALRNLAAEDVELKAWSGGKHFSDGSEPPIAGDYENGF